MSNSEFTKDQEVGQPMGCFQDENILDISTHLSAPSMPAPYNNRRLSRARRRPWQRWRDSRSCRCCQRRFLARQRQYVGRSSNSTKFGRPFNSRFISQNYCFPCIRAGHPRSRERPSGNRAYRRDPHQREMNDQSDWQSRVGIYQL